MVYVKGYKIHRLGNYEKPRGYKYYNYFITNKGDFVIWSRDGKRYYIDGASNSKIYFYTGMPFAKSTDAINYLKRKLNEVG